LSIHRRSSSFGLLLSVASSLLSALGGIYSEKLLKGRASTSIHWQNIQLYIWGVLFNGLGTQILALDSGKYNSKRCVVTPRYHSEKLLKGRASTSIHWQNILLYIWGVLFNGLGKEILALDSGKYNSKRCVVTPRHLLGEAAQRPRLHLHPHWQNIQLYIWGVLFNGLGTGVPTVSSYQPRPYTTPIHRRFIFTLSG